MREKMKPEIKYKVVWKDNVRKLKNKHGIYESKDEAYKSILDWWSLNKFNPMYIKQWENKQGVVTIDYGNDYYLYKIIPIENKRHNKSIFK